MILRIACRHSLPVMLVTLIAPVPAAADVLTVPTEYPSIQAAIDAAADGDEIVVLPFVETLPIDFGAKSLTLRSTSGAAQTFIDGSAVTDVTMIRIEPEWGDETHVVIDGFTIRHTSSPATANPDPSALACQTSGRLTLRNCSFLENAAGSGRPVVSFNGIIDPQTPSLTIESCVIEQNAAGPFSWAVFVSGSARVCDTTFRSNLGSALNAAASDLVVERCTFQANARALDVSFSTFTITDTTFRENTEKTLWVAEAGGVVSGCTFEANHAVSGGAVEVSDFANVTLDRCRIVGNSADVEGGGILVTLAATADIRGCLIAGNDADARGGGIHVGVGDLTSVVDVINTTMVGNTAAGPGKTLSVTVCAFECAAEVALTNCIVRSVDPIAVSAGTTLTIAHSTVTNGWPGTGNLDVDPGFVDVAGGDYRLGAGSPCIDAADSTAVPEELVVDLLGRTRFVDDPETPDTGVPDAKNRVVDMGAYEFPGCPADIDGDGEVRLDDLIAVLSTWGPCSDCAADVNGDGVIDFLDLVIVLSHWGACG